MFGQSQLTQRSCQLLVTASRRHEMSVQSLRFSFVIILLLSVTALAVVYFFVLSGSTPRRRTTAIVSRPTTNSDTSPSNSRVQKDGRNHSAAVWKTESCEGRFVKAYEQYCQQALHPQTSNIPSEYRNLSSSELSNHLCSCVPTHLRKYPV